MMQVQKGQVKYKDRSDIICTYGINDAGKQYYFLDGEKLNNGSFIASTALVEAIDPLVVSSNIGVISFDGEVVIPFDNKTVKVISDEVLLVEKVTPSTKSVIDAVSMRKDPLAATKLVTTPATIKDRMNTKMGNGGRFVFNDQFSEATVFDLDGNNLLNGEYYSFIGINNGTLYMSKNTIDSEIVEYKLYSEQESSGAEELLDVQEVKVEQEVIDKAMEISKSVPVSPVISTKDDENEKVEKDSKVETESETESESESETESESEKIFHTINFNAIEDVEDFKDVELKETEEKNKKEEGTKSIFEKTNDKETRVSLFEGLNFENEDNSFDDKKTNKSDSVIEDAATMLSKLIDKNKKQREIIKNYEEKINDLMLFKKQAFNENQKLLKENNTMKIRIETLENELNNTTDKIEALSAQVAGKGDLAKLLADAEDLLND